MTQDQGNQKPILEDIWMIRPCGVYLDEFKECTDFRSRFHQKYTVGYNVDCDQWKKDYDTCKAYSNSKSARDAEALVESERQRRIRRINTVRNNDVWQYRTSPPEDWNSPLPEHLMRNAVPEVTGKSSSSFCVIS